MKYRVRHTTSYAYASKVDLASHVLHLSPRRLAYQRVGAVSITADPDPTRRSEGVDHFGNGVVRLFLDLPHRAFEVTLTAEVEVAFPAPPAPEETPPWEQVAAAAAAGGAAWRAAEFAFPSPMAPADPAAGAYAKPSFPAGRPILEGLLDLMRRINRDFAFRAGVTTINTPIAEVLERQAGVCQDFTHLMIAGLRCLGLPGRYVSGYLRTKPPPGQMPRRGADQSHAWVGAWMGPGLGWVDLDPTNDIVVREEPVVLAWGRDYGDISPVRGVILGGGRHSVDVGVDLEALDG